MAQENFNVSLPNDGLGDELRAAFIKQQNMNTDLYANKVNKEIGKGLSQNDFTTTLKDKLDGIAYGAEVNVQSDWLQNDNTADNFIKNKPTVLQQDNIRIIKTVFLDEVGGVNNNVVFVSNQLENYEVQETQLLSIKAIVLNSSNEIVRVELYDCFNAGKGFYGVGGTQLTSANFSLPIIASVTVATYEDLPTTDTIVIEDLGGLSVAQFVNAKNPPYVVQNIADGRTLFATPSGIYLFLLDGGNYGVGGITNLVSANFTLLSNTPSIPTDTTVIQGSTNPVSGSAVFDFGSTKANLYGGNSFYGGQLFNNGVSFADGLSYSFISNIRKSEAADSRVFKQSNDELGNYFFDVADDNTEFPDYSPILKLNKNKIAEFINPLKIPNGIGLTDAVNLGQIYGKNVLIVAKQNGQYSTIDSALSYAKINSTQANPITILVYPGVYKEFIGIPPDKYISLIGVNRESCILLDDSGDYYQAPILMAGNVVVENMTIIANSDNISSPAPAIPSYAIHHDNTGEGKSYIRNCTMISYQNAAIGIGLQNNQQLTIENCTMIGIGAAAGGLLMHTDVRAGSTNQKMTVINSYIQADNLTPVALIDSNNNGGSAGDNRDTELTFEGVTIFSTSIGIDNSVYGTAPMGGGDFGYMKLTQQSRNNTLKVLNKRPFSLDSDVLHKTGNETKEGSLALINNSAISSFIHEVYAGGDLRFAEVNHVSSKKHRITSDVSAYGDLHIQVAQTNGANDFVDLLIFNPDKSASFVGNVGIGVTSPTEKLEVNGRIKLQPATQANHAVALGQIAELINTTNSSYILTNLTAQKTNIFGNNNSDFQLFLPQASLHSGKEISVTTTAAVGKVGINSYNVSATEVQYGNSLTYSTGGNTTYTLISNGTNWVIVNILQ